MNKNLVIKNVDSLEEIRLLVNNVCNYSCSFPETGIKWCHGDGICCGVSSIYKSASINDFLFLVGSLKKAFGIKKVKIGAMEPLLFAGITELISGLKNLGCAEVSLTTNGYFLQNQSKQLKESGLDTLTVSMHAFSENMYRKITRVDGFDRVKKSVEEASRLGFRKIKINRVLLNFDGLWDDLMTFFDWSVVNKITAVKLYQLIWSEGMKGEDYFKNYSPWQALSVFLRRNAYLKEIRRYKMAGRDRLIWELKNGLELETDVFYHKFDDKLPDLCRKCNLAPFCQEGLMSYGIEIGPELIVSGCLLRRKISLDLWDLVKKRDAEGLVKSLEAFIGKIRK
ncbi:radical SAM protein [Patescibacteria group bacterium]|nr:radical SAM protein [Patescibacteria group bacterium]